MTARERAKRTREALDLVIVALQMILQRQRAVRGLPEFDERIFSIAYFALNHLGRLDQEPDPNVMKLIQDAISAQSDS